MKTRTFLIPSIKDAIARPQDFKLTYYAIMGFSLSSTFEDNYRSTLSTMLSDKQAQWLIKYWRTALWHPLPLP